MAQDQSVLFSISTYNLKDEDINEIKNISNKLLNNELYSPLIINKLNKKVTNFLENKKYVNFEINVQDAKFSDDKINVIIQINDGQKS
ncbi:MAG: hypothetical protein EBU61_01115, partial [Crocinitomicaceae bacterium]|nr:hypothetical protein [Crocinitomicaceae bacterium]